MILDCIGFFPFIEIIPHIDYKLISLSSRRKPPKMSIAILSIVLPIAVKGISLPRDPVSF